MSVVGTSRTTRLPDVVRKHEDEILTHWLQEQLQADTLRNDLIKESELRAESQQFLALFKNALQVGGTDINQPQWLSVKEFLSELSRGRAVKGFTSSATATFVMSLKQPLLSRLLHHCGNNLEEFEKEAWSCNVIVDGLALYTVEVYSKGREEVIGRQQQEMLELSTPVVRLFEGVLALPLIGTLDSARTQVVMESLLTRIVETGASIAIIDITGVPMVDTLVAQHLLKTVAAARLMGADCIISGIRPQIAQTIVHLGVNLAEVTTKATMADAFMVALQRLGLVLRRVKSGGAANQEQ